jgi:ATP-dependent DNA helicase RecQ
MPKSIESYFQETGRAGRDGGDSECILFYSRGDAGKIRSLLEGDGSEERFVRLALRKLQDIAEYCESPSCRRKLLLNYFGEEYPEENCGSCDNCDQPPEMIDGTAVAKKIVACVKQLPSQYGVALITDVLTGSKSSKVQNYHLDTIPAYNTVREYSKPQLRIWIGELIRQGYLARTGDTYPVIRLTHKSHSIGEGDMSLMLTLPEQGTVKKSLPPLHSVTTNTEEKLFLYLKTLRKSIADQANVPPYVIFPDKSLREMAHTKPCDLHNFRNIGGVGEIKLEKYGLVFTSAIKTFCEEIETK